MPVIGGESIGTAYVNIVMNGDDLPRSIRSEMKRASSEYKKAGREHGEDYSAGFGMTARERLKFIGDDISRRFGDPIKKMFKEVDAEGNKLTFDKRLGRGFDRVSLQIGQAGVRLRSFRQDLRDLSSEDVTESIVNGFRRVGFWAGDARIKVDRLGSRVRDFVRRDAKGIEDVTDSFSGSRSERTHAGLTKLIEDIDLLGERTSSTFGRGSRNNFIHFFGGLVGGTVSLLGVLPRVVKGVLGLGQGISTVFSTMKAGGSFTEGLAAAGTSLASLAAGATAAGVGIAALVIILPAFVSILTLLGGVVVALAGSLTFALVGGLAAVSALVLPLAAGLGVLVGAIASMDDKTKSALKDSIRPFITEMKNLGDIAADELFKDAPEQAERLGKAFDGLDTLVRRSASALSDVADTFINGLNSKNFDEFVAVLETFIPRALRSLGHIAADTLGGVGGLFRVIAGPGGIANQMLDWLERISDEFNTWANSAEGQSSIADFFDRAATSARSLGELLDNIGELLGEVFTAGQGTGDTIIDQMADKVQQFTDYLNANPGAVQRFFGDVGDFATSVGRAINAVFHLIDALDSPQSRKAATFLFSAIEAGVTFSIGVFTIFETVVMASMNHIAAGWTRVAVVFGNVAGAIVSAMGSVAAGIANAIDVIPDRFLPDWAEDARDSLRGFAEDSKVAADRLRAIGDVKPKIEVDDSELKGLKETANTTDASLRILLGLPPIKPVTDKKQLDAAKASADRLAKGLTDIFVFPGSTVRVNKVQADNARLAALLAKREFEEMYGVASKGTTLKINAASARVARNIVADLKNLLNSLPLFKTIKVNTIQSKESVGARGGVLDHGRLQAQRYAAGGLLSYQQKISPYATGGEAGRELIVPLDKPLGQVDASVRELAAIARGMSPGGRGESKIIYVQPTIVTPTKDPWAVAREVGDELAVTGAY